MVCLVILERSRVCFTTADIVPDSVSATVEQWHSIVIMMHHILDGDRLSGSRLWSTKQDFYRNMHSDYLLAEMLMSC